MMSVSDRFLRDLGEGTCSVGRHPKSLCVEARCWRVQRGPHVGSILCYPVGEPAPPARAARSNAPHPGPFSLRRNQGTICGMHKVWKRARVATTDFGLT